MKTIVTISLACLFAAAAGTAYSQSLAELAKKEKERRAKMKEAAKVITDHDTSKYKAGAVTTGGAAPEGSNTLQAGTEALPGADVAKTGEKTAVVNPDEPVDFEGRTESFWRQSFADARTKVRELEDQANVLTLRLNDLQNKFYNEDNGFTQQQIQKDIQKTIYEQDLNRENLAKARKELSDLEAEARKSGALPGWLRENNP